MHNFEEEIEYFLSLVKQNMEIVQNNRLKNISKKEMVFFNFNINLKGEELVVYNQEKDLIYEISTEKIEKFDFKNINKNYILDLIKILNQYENNKLTFKKYLNLFNKQKLYYNIR